MCIHTFHNGQFLPLIFHVDMTHPSHSNELKFLTYFVYIFIWHLLENFSKIISGRIRDIFNIRLILITQLIIIQYLTIKNSQLVLNQWCLSKIQKYHREFVKWAAKTTSQNSRVCYLAFHLHFTQCQQNPKAGL